jgi:hypothetical protein
VVVDGVLSEDCGGVCEDVSRVESCCGGSMTGTPVRECRRGGIIETDWDVGVRMSRRRGLAICLVCDLEGSAGEQAEAVGVMVRYSGGISAIWMGISRSRNILNDPSRVQEKLSKERMVVGVRVGGCGVGEEVWSPRC